MGLQTGAELARTQTAIISPSTLAIVAYVVEGPNLDHDPSLLLVKDIREMGDVGMIIDSSDEFVSDEDVIKLKPLYDLGFTVVDKQVLDEKRRKLGKVTDYVVDADSFVIQQLNVKRPLLKSLNDAELVIHRSQIVEVNDTEIIVKMTDIKATAVVQRATTRAYVNPFRHSNPQPETIDSKQ